MGNTYHNLRKLQSAHLDGDYAAFGKITEGLEVVDQIANAPRNIQDCPNQPIVIKTIKRG